METINLRLEKVEGNEIIIREGDALPPVAPKKIVISGDIKTVSSFIAKRKLAIAGIAGYQFIEPNRAIVEVDKQKMQIVLHVDPQDEYGPVVTAKLEINPDLQQFDINGKKTFRQKELVDILKFSRLLFADPDMRDRVFKAYQAFNYVASATGKSESDLRGNKDNSFKKTVVTGLPEQFVMNIPVFKGGEARKFMVEICLEVTDGGASFWFVSVELHELIQIESERILNEQLKSCEDYVVIWK